MNRTNLKNLSFTLLLLLVAACGSQSKPLKLANSSMLISDHVQVGAGAPTSSNGPSTVVNTTLIPKVVSTTVNTSSGIGTDTRTTTSSSAISDACTDVRFDQPAADGTPGSMQFVPVRDQGAYGICYAETATQMVDAYRFSVLKDPAHELHSAVLSTAVGLNIELNKDPFAGGQICNATNFIKTDGYYDSFSVSTCIVKHETKDVVTTLSSFYDAFWMDQNNYKKTQAVNLAPDALNAAWSVHFNDGLASLTQQIQDWLGTQGVLSYLKPSQAVIKDLLSLTKLRFIWGIEGYQCFAASPTYHVELPSCKNTNILNYAPTQRVASMNSLLDHSNGQPIGISYCDRVLTVGASYGGVGSNGGAAQCIPVLDSKRNVIPGNGMHASLVMGRRKNPKNPEVCQFLVRNSWGATCKTKPSPVTLPDDLKNDPSLPFSFQKSIAPSEIYAPEWDCDGGNIWVDATALAKSVYSLSTFSAKVSK